MIGADELLALLADKKVTQAEIARLLDLPASRVSEMYKGTRRLQLDEAKKLVEHYQLEETITPLNIPIARLLVLHAATAFGVAVSSGDPRVEEVAQDFRAFSQFATDPQVRSSAEAVQGFFRGLRLAQDRAGAA